jgi:hypothetical protein
MHLDLALDALGGASNVEMNMTTTTGEGTTGGVSTNTQQQAALKVVMVPKY